MPIGTFLDAMPPILFVAAHVVFLAVGLWVIKNGTAKKIPITPAFWLYAVSQVVFLAFFGGIFTIKMAVLLEQTLMLIMVVWIGTKASAQPQR